MKTAYKFGDMENYSIYMVNEKMGLAGSPNGEKDNIKITPPLYDVIYPFIKEYAIVKSGNCYGVINKFGEEVIPFDRYSSISPNVEEFIFDAYEKATHRYVRLDYLNNLLEKETPYADIKKEVGEILGVNPNELYDIIQVGCVFLLGYNHKRLVYNRDICKVIYKGSKAILVNDMFLIVKDSNDKEGVIDIEGNLLTPYIYDKMYGYDYEALVYPIIDFFYSPENIIKAEINGNAGYIDFFGNIKIPFIYKWCGSFENGYAAVMGSDKKIGLIDEHGNMIEPMVHDDIDFISDGNIAYIDEGPYSSKYFLKDKPKDYVQLSDQYTSFHFNIFKSPNYVCVTNKAGKKGIISIDGKIKLPTIYTKIYIGLEILNNGVITSKDFDHYGIVDLNNNVLLPFEFNSIETCLVKEEEREAIYYIVEKEYKYGVINNKFKEMIPIIYNRVEYKEEYNCFYVETDDENAMLDYNNAIVVPFTSAHI